MTRSSRPAVGLAVGGTIAAAASATAFITGVPVLGGARSLTIRHAARDDGSISSFEGAPHLHESSADAAEEDHFASALKWLGAGLLAGVVMATSAPPALADIPAGMPGPGSLWTNKPYDVDKYGLPPAPSWIEDPKTLAKNPKDRPILRDQLGNPAPRGIPKDQTPLNPGGELGFQPLEPCRKNKKFKKIVKDEVFVYKIRRDKYVKGTTNWNMFQADIEAAKRREKAYGDRLCGYSDGQPRFMALPDARAGYRGQIWPLFFAFVYSAGCIGWAGRSYLQRTRSAEKEIFLDLPLALTCIISSPAFPVQAWKEVLAGQFTANEYELRNTGQTHTNPFGYRDDMDKGRKGM